MSVFAVPKPVEMRDGVPVFLSKQFGNRWRRIPTMLLLDTLPLPCWIDTGDSATKLTPENKQGIIVGMMLATDMEEEVHE